MNKSKLRFIIIRLVAAILILLAFRHNPYGYYIILRWVVCAIFIYCAIRAHRETSEAWTWIFGVNAALYNPIFPLHLGRQIWSTVNIVSTILIIVSFFTLKRKKAALEEA
jgi:FtsH-binding integral membrane protein